MTANTQAVGKVFQIGFNKCGTKSFAQLFSQSGYPAVHYRVPRRERPRIRLVEAMERNRDAGRKLFAGYDDIVFFCDMERNTAENRFDGYKLFRDLLADYPDARFLLNLRDPERWIRSRLAHERQLYAQKYMACFGIETLEDLKAHWLEDWHTHIADVRGFFADKPGKLVEFDIETDDVSVLLEFFSDLDLSPDAWAHKGKMRGKPLGD